MVACFRFVVDTRAVLQLSQMPSSVDEEDFNDFMDKVDRSAFKLQQLIAAYDESVPEKTKAAQTDVRQDTRGMQTLNNVRVRSWVLLTISTVLFYRHT